MKELKRGQIWLVDLPEGKGSIQNKLRPCILISNDLANYHSPVLHICPVTSISSKSKLPTHIEIGKKCGLLRDSIVLCEQTMLVTRDVFINQVGECDEETLKRIDRGMVIQFGLQGKEIKDNIAYA